MQQVGIEFCECNTDDAQKVYNFKCAAPMFGRELNITS
jgi:hypothetical protein